MVRGFAALIFLVALGCSRAAPIDRSHISVCTLATLGSELDGQHVSLRAIGNFTHGHGIFFTDNACRDAMIFFDATPGAARSSYLAQGDQNLDVFRDAELDLSGVFHWNAARNPSTGAQDWPKTIVVDEIRSLTFVDVPLSRGCEGIGRSRRFCDCLEGRLGAEAKPEHRRALLDIMVRLLPDPGAQSFSSWPDTSQFRSAVAGARYDTDATRAAFVQCAANARY